VIVIRIVRAMWHLYTLSIAIRLEQGENVYSIVNGD
jgi:hypothetical protein